MEGTCVHYYVLYFYNHRIVVLFLWNYTDPRPNHNCLLKKQSLCAFSMIMVSIIYAPIHVTIYTLTVHNIIIGSG